MWSHVVHKNRKPIFGVGINDWESPVYMGNKQMKEYQVWVSMLARCFSNKEKARKPCYESSSCSDDWLLFSNFVRDLRLMTGFDNMMKLSWQLDKDLILKGNKNYSSEVCCLIPKELNVFLTNGASKRGGLPLGVHERKNENLTKTFVSSIFYKGKSIHLGYFNDPLVAHLSYKVKKEELLKIYAEDLFGTIDDRAYNALINYKVEITD